MFGSSERMRPCSWAEVESLWHDAGQEAAGLREGHVAPEPESAADERPTAARRGPTIPESFLFG